MENSMPMLLFGLNEPNSIERAVAGENIGTLVHN
jgi:uridylate kinase